MNFAIKIRLVGESPQAPARSKTVMRKSKRRTKQICVRLTDEELQAINALVDRTPYSRETFLRKAATGAKLCENLPADYPGILRELRRIGSNVDQLLVKARALGFVDEVSLRSIKEQVNRMDAVFGQSFGDWEGRRKTWR